MRLPSEHPSQIRTDTLALTHPIAQAKLSRYCALIPSPPPGERASSSPGQGILGTWLYCPPPFVLRECLVTASADVKKRAFPITWAEFQLLCERFSDPILTALTVMLSLLLFVIAPMQIAGVISGQWFGIAFGFVLIPGALLVSHSAVAVGSIFFSIALVILAAILEMRGVDIIIDLYFDAAAWLIAGLTLSVVVARAVFAPGRITYHRIVGAILLYICLGVIFVSLFGFVSLLLPKAFTNMAPLSGNFGLVGDLIYFSFVTLTTTGYGDISPVHPYARSLVNIEAIIGQLYPATLLARLVTLEIADRARP